MFKTNTLEQFWVNKEEFFERCAWTELTRLREWRKHSHPLTTLSPRVHSNDTHVYKHKFILLLAELLA